MDNFLTGRNDFLAVDDGAGGTKVVLNTPPALGSGVGNVLHTVVESTRPVVTLLADDPDRLPLTYSLGGGPDAAAFVIDARTGALSFIRAPNAEKPGDADGDGVYEVRIRASDGALSDVVAIGVAVTNAKEALIRGTSGDDVVGPGLTVPGQPLPSASDDTIMGRAGDDSLSGLAGNDRLNGNQGDDRVAGGKGDDTLIGCYGRNVLIGGEGDDTFVFHPAFARDSHPAFVRGWLAEPQGTSLSFNRIADFTPGEDTILLAGLKNLPDHGSLPASAFHLGREATNPSHHVLYDGASGVLFYDPDGSGALAPIRIGILDKDLPLTGGDFLLD